MSGEVKQAQSAAEQSITWLTHAVPQTSGHQLIWMTGAAVIAAVGVGFFVNRNAPSSWRQRSENIEPTQQKTR